MPLNIENTAKELIKIPRYTVSDGYDAVLNAIKNLIDLKIYNFVTDSRVNGFPVPERWLCKAAKVENTDGLEILSINDIAPYSKAQKCTVNREALPEHLYTDKEHIKDWGFYRSQEAASSLTDSFYNITTDSDFSYSPLKVGEYIVEGKIKHLY